MRTLLLTFVLLLLFHIEGQSQKLSNEATISLLTCAPGEELYSLFGHSALRVQDSSQNLDVVFNYGTFDFNTPNFYIKFAKGRLDYLLSAADFYDFTKNYQRERRSIYSQQLLLDSLQKQRLFDALIENYQPQNRAYKYDFFMDNCATRIDEIIKKTVPGAWQDLTPLDKLQQTYRTGIAPYLANSDWLNLGLNIILGNPTDNKQQGLFLPDIMQEHFAKTTLNGKPLAANTETLYDAHFHYSKTPFWKSPQMVFYLLAALFLTGLFFPSKGRLGDFLLFFAAGIAGCIITFLWFGSDHVATNQNWNVLWALPTHLPAAFFLFRKKSCKWVRFYFLFSFILTVIIFLFVTISPPAGFPSLLLLPILLCIIFSSLRIIKRNS